MTDLSPDEKTVLLIAHAGGPMAPIGRWKEPTLSLVAKEFLKPRPHPGDPTGYFNHHITPSGEAAATTLDREDDVLLGEINLCRAHAEQIAVQIVDLAELSVQVTGDSKIEAAKRWGEVIGKRVLEMLK